MKNDKAYKLLALQEGVSNSRAKDWIDRGLVYVKGERLSVARAEFPAATRFKVQQPRPIEVLSEDEHLLAVNKPAFLTSDEVAGMFGEARLLHRLDRETSGILLMAKDAAFEKAVLREFKERRVEKIYTCWVKGRIAEALKIDKPILSVKQNGKAFSRVDKRGKEAISYVEPLLVVGRYSKIRVRIETGRTHQIRVHLQSAGFPIVGDRQYGIAVLNVKRMLLHAGEVRLMDYRIEAPEEKGFDRLASEA